MKLVYSIFALFIGSSLMAQDGIKFFKGSWEEVLAKAQKEHKIIFVDAYTTWCGPCKRMSKQVFPDEAVGKFYNKHFINYKMDMEKGEGPTFAQKYRVNSYPTLLFIDYDGEVVNMGKGARPVEQFIALGKETLSKYDKTGDFAEKYENGERDPEFLRAYAYALMASAKPTLKIANEYRHSQSDWTSKENLTFLYDFATQADSKLFELMLEHKDQIIELKGEKAFKEQVYSACMTTVDKAIEYGVKDLLDEAVKKMKEADRKEAKEFQLLAEMHYARHTEAMQDYIKLTQKYVKKFAKNDADRLHKHASAFLHGINDKEALLEAEKWAKQAFELDKNLKHRKTYIQLLQRNGKTEEAKKLLPKQNLPSNPAKMD